MAKQVQKEIKSFDGLMIDSLKKINDLLLAHNRYMFDIAKNKGKCTKVNIIIMTKALKEFGLNKLQAEMIMKSLTSYSMGEQNG